MLVRLNANFDKTVNLKAKMFVTLSDPVQGKAKTQIVPKRRCLVYATLVVSSVLSFEPVHE